MRQTLHPAYLLLLLAGTLMLAADAAAATRFTRDGAPYQIVRSSGTDVVVDIGSDRGASRPLRVATIVTEVGAVTATLVRTRRVCEWLCGDDDDEGKECHFEAVLRASRRVDRPLAVIAGRVIVTDLTPLSVGTDLPIQSEARWLNATPFGSETDGFRWRTSTNGIYLSSFGAIGLDFYSQPVALTSCREQAVGPFTLLACEGATARLLYEDSVAVVASLADYTTAIALPTHRLRLGGQEAFLLRLGLKAQEVVALLVREGDGWRLALRGADYSLLC